MTPSTTVINPRMRPATAIPLPTPPRLLAADMPTAPKIIARIARTQSKNGTHEKTMLMIPSTRAVTASPLPCGCATAPPYGYGCAYGGGAGAGLPGGGGAELMGWVLLGRASGGAGAS